MACRAGPRPARPPERQCRLAGLNPTEVTRGAVASRDLAGARDIASVLDARIRQRVHPLLPQPQGRCASRVPQRPDPERQAHLAGIAAMMDDRAQRLGQHTAHTAPPWAVAALGPVPASPAARRDWEHKAAPVAALPGDIRLPAPSRPDRPRAQPRVAGPAGRLA
jgi:hypothetical protein